VPKRRKTLSSDDAAPTVSTLLAEAVSAIAGSPAIDHWQPSVARYDAEELMAAVTGSVVDGASRRRRLGPEQRRKFRRMVKRRVAGEPVPRITGTFPFRGMELDIRDGVFVPRVSTELLAGEAIKTLRRRRPPRVAVDVATGAGPIALAMANEVGDAEVWGVDISADAVSLGRHNAKRLKLANARFRVSDVLDGLPRRLRGAVDVITVHPPYVARGEVKTLPTEIRDFEPRVSLTDNSADGLGLVRQLAESSHMWLRPGGMLLVEIGTYLSRGAQSTLRRAGLTDVGWTRDSLGVTRVVSGRAPRRPADAVTPKRRPTVAQ
jgi:release factor glutamine methyltransferase